MTGGHGDIIRARHHGLGDLLRRTAARLPDKTAIVDGETSFTYSEFDEVVDRIGAALTARSLAKGDRCAVLSHNCWEVAALSFATARQGIVLVPINFMLRAGEIAYILEHAEVRAFVCEAELLPTGNQALAASGLTDVVRCVLREGSWNTGGWECLDTWRASAEVPASFVAVDDDDPIRLMYTSGTESRPKGVMLSGRSLMWQYVGCIIDGSMEPDDVELHALPLYHCAQLDCFLGPDVYLGATSVIAPSPEPGLLLRMMARYRITKFFAPPTVWISLLRHPEFDTTDLSTLAKGYYGASPMPVEILREIGTRLPKVRLWNFYGQTEMAPIATVLRPHEQVDFAGSAGRPSINVETAIFDEDDRPLPPSQVGEIVHRSPQATLGYYREPEKTAEAFRNGWFHTGDLGLFDERGTLRVVDRKKDMIKTGGENVASREVEEAIYLLDGVVEVAVFAVPDPHWVEAVTAAVVVMDGSGITAEDVVAHARKHLARFKAPKNVFVVADLPKNPSGKILKRVLRERYLADPGVV